MAVHQDALAVASVAQAQGADVVSLGTIGTRQGALDQRRRPRQSQRTPRGCVDAAGPCGSWLARSRRQPGNGCWGVAPSWLPNTPGARVTPDRCEARPRARLRRAGDLTPVSVPARDDAALRALRRARAATLRALQAATVRRTACVRRPARRSPGRAHWRPAPLRWRSAVGCPPPAPPLVLQADVQPVTAPTARVGRRARALHAQGPTGRCAPVVEALPAVRGVQGPVAGTTVAALGALTRCETPRQRRHDLGRTPSASARGARRQPGRLTQTGPPPARRALGAGAWASRSPATVRRPLPRCLAKLPTALQAIRGQAQGRLGTRDRPLLAQGKPAQQVVGAMARAWRACLGAMAQHRTGTPHASNRRLVCRPSAPRCARPSAAPPPRCGVTRGGVLRPTGPLVPRLRQAPDGGQEGGSQPTASSGIHRRDAWLRLFRETKGKNSAADVKKLLPTLDIGSHSNARFQPPLEAEATQERML
jgi:transposase